MLKIAFLVAGNHIAGGNFIIYRHALYLKKKGHDVHLIFKTTHEPLKLWYPVEDLNSFYFDDVIKSDHKYDVVFATWWDSFYYMTKVQADRYFYFCQSDERRFYSVDPVDKNDHDVAAFVHLSYTVRDVGFITEARWIKKMLESEFGSKVAYAPNGIDNSVFHPHIIPNEERPTHKIRFLVEGPGQVPFKRVDLAFKALEKYRDQCEVWYISSDGHCDERWKPDRLFKKVPFEKMPALYRSCHCLIKLSVVEGFFGPPLEIMATGGTAIVSNVSGFDEYVVHDQNALVVPMNDQKGTELAIEKIILGGPSYALKLGTQGHATAKSLDWSLQMPKFEVGLLQLLDQVPRISSTSLNYINIMTTARDRYFHLRKLDPDKVHNLRDFFRGIKIYFSDLVNFFKFSLPQPPIDKTLKAHPQKINFLDSV